MGKGCPISADAEAFLRAVLCRDPCGRFTAEEALDDPWIEDLCRGSSGGELPSLQPTLKAAKQLGVLDMPKSRLKGNSALDAFLKKRQVQAQKAAELQQELLKQMDARCL